MEHRAGFWIRFIALIIDTIILSIVQFVLSFLISGYSLTEMNVLSSIINLILTFLYFVWLQVKFNGQTIGKKITGIRVANLEGERVTIGQMTLREIIGKLVSGFILLIGFLMAAGRSKRALHDYIAKTIVIRAE
ncbi:putative membrane protein/domain [Schinkia azotoformans MEV2011]|uniref:Putative membrane protein/domain n=1 Tax=Schinkia azotoformans MEV2011 TaxID=1348973 RepID=A0A072NN93_SCHAZ|nr:RDD family protein [Schinkia azotoformans]KEF38936.1 putative membrane protein/domain [Schinkia azotoformans MEV2011]MEC1694501.1 RDD family protein [Schinkia azotoformans]MEC1714540.1 RDD family protein [Schinkia azotoformans]MEC1723311.1 RDD family protein [Schinkia azotoformans]MEC1740366.1 RDD family protein [Schinkia azotoformans]